VSRGCVAVAAFGMNICIFGCKVQQLVGSFHSMGLGKFSLCTQPHISTEFDSQQTGTKAML
jgi:hypothetical protein